jgi:hypothetical protein
MHRMQAQPAACSLARRAEGHGSAGSVPCPPPPPEKPPCHAGEGRFLSIELDVPPLPEGFNSWMDTEKMVKVGGWGGVWREGLAVLS